jgi:hypothetical protein
MAKSSKVRAQEVIFETSARRSRYITSASRIRGLVASHNAKWYRLIAQNPSGLSHMLAGVLAKKHHCRLRREAASALKETPNGDGVRFA